jgi:hypothetical protein
MIKVRKTKGSILTARPDGMDYETYRVARKQQEKMIKDRLRYGFMVWPSKGIFGVKDKNGAIIPVQRRITTLR